MWVTAENIFDFYEQFRLWSLLATLGRNSSQVGGLKIRCRLFIASMNKPARHIRIIV
jgi:hypothetical protein